MLYFGYLPKTTIADIIPVIVAGFDSKFIKPCTPEIADDGTLFYTEHQQYVIDNASPEHPLKFRSVDWNFKVNNLKQLSTNNVFVGNYYDHSTILEDIDHISLTVTSKQEYMPLVKEHARMFNNYCNKEFTIKHFDRLLDYDQPVSDFNIDLLDLFNEAKLIQLMTELGTLNDQKIKFVRKWLNCLKSNTRVSKILLDLRPI
jgi:hypothetical protein